MIPGRSAVALAGLCQQLERVQFTINEIKMQFAGDRREHAEAYTRALRRQITVLGARARRMHESFDPANYAEKFEPPPAPTKPPPKLKVIE